MSETNETPETEAPKERGTSVDATAPIPTRQRTEVVENLGTPEQMIALFAALADARLEVEPVSKDGQTKGSQAYKFASAQAILGLGGPLLAKHGLSLMPKSSNFDEPHMMLYREWHLLHRAGGRERLESMTPVVCTQWSNSSQPIDKAMAAAMTVNHRFMMRDLLAIPAVDVGEEIENRSEEDVRSYARPGAGRTAERKEKPQQQQQQKQAAPPPEKQGDKEPEDKRSEEEKNADLLKRKTDLKKWIGDARTELGVELVKQLGFDVDPKSMHDAEALWKKLRAALIKKRENAAAAAKAKPAEEKPADAPATDMPPADDTLGMFG